ncbi:slr1659 superfamily regulator [Microseira wollei]|uniref:STAS domain-containing protein n=1 Tax=Microseira wollei NIES-4236 TaxID=2530354 RepID=A0AAV3WIY0_9CYAN|nr:STAS domain-containing protein [Microseira wollei]GET39744.1 hypothetical protein MiSe_45160 [Microseira wollei NIES-4236]
MEIRTEHYSIYYDKLTETAIFNGSLRLSGIEEYYPIVQLLNDLAEQQPSTITLNLRQLDFLNSSGINVLSKFVIKVREKGNIQMVVLGSNEVPWQGKSLKNLQRLMPSLNLVLE